MNTSTTDGVRVVRAGEGRASWALGSLFERLAGGETSPAPFDAVIVTQPEGLATPLHVHTHETEAWLILEGNVRYQAGAETFDLGAGDFIHLPQHVPHGYRVTGPGPVRFLALAFPGALMSIYEEIGVPATERRLPTGGIPSADAARWNALAPDYGLQVVGPPLPPAVAERAN